MEKTEIVMDYEKEYKDALERAQKVTRAGGDVAMEIVQSIFPELRDSEDERIRRRLINLIKELAANKEAIHTGGYFVDGQDKKYIAYLEKQKENPKSADSIPSDCVSDAKCEGKSPKHSDSDGTDIRDTPAYWKGWDDAMKQKEQKHPNGCFTCDEYKKGYESGRLNGFTAGYNKAMKEIDQKEQKPADRFEEAREKYQVEWSKEEAAGEYASDSTGFTDMTAYRAFIAGWKCRDDQMPMPEDTVLFNKGVAEGRRLEREDLLKDAVEGRVFMSFAPGHNQMVMADVDLPTNTKVRIVVLKEEEE